MTTQEDVMVAKSIVDTLNYYPTVRLKWYESACKLDGERAIKQAEEAEKQHLALYQALGFANIAKAQAYLAANHPEPSYTCQYCGRTNQKHGHTSCDGCGAPR